jgi:hypothetical protein
VNETRWSLDELTRRVGEALASTSGYAGAPNGRVRDVPDARAIRWYATRGLLDRPGIRGRTAAYGPRHLLQLVVIKRRQAEGRALAEIQAEVAGATDADLRAIAGVPDALLDGAVPAVAPSVGAVPAAEAPPRPPRTRFWAEPAAPVDPAPASLRPTGVLTGVPLDSDVILLLGATPDSDDLAAIHVAARPLLDLLAHRGLRTRREGARDDDRVDHLDDPG